ncbi:MAG TPA: ATP-binding protein [Solirubrobacterales bacterium]|nr:ATP-binding protein [Solirubrobacterales bacterium]
MSNFDGQLESELTQCDLSSLKFVDAYGLVALACAMNGGLRSGDDFELIPPSRASMRGHLAGMGFNEFLGDLGKPRMTGVGRKVDASDVVVPLSSAMDSGGEQAIVAMLWEQLQDQVGPQILDAIGEGVWEMVANALEHSGADACVMAQVYRADKGGTPPDHNDRVQVVIGDVGRGIRDSLASSPAHDPETDLEAIDLALEYLVTSVHDDPGRGQGLSTTLEQVTSLGGQMIVRTGTGKLSVKDGRRHAETVAPLAGTVVALSLPLYPG